MQKTLDDLIDRGDISSRDLDTRTMDALEGRQLLLFSSHDPPAQAFGKQCSHDSYRFCCASCLTFTRDLML